MTTHFRSLGLLATIALLSATPAANAQSVDAVPTRPVVAAPAATGHPHQTVDLEVSLYGAYDDDTLADLGSVGSSPFRQSGFYSGLSSDLAYAWQGQRLQFGATASTSGRYYGNLRDFIWVSHSAGVGLTANFAKRTTLSVNQSVAYAPSYLYRLFASTADPGPGETLPAGEDYRFTDQRGLTYSTTAALSHGLSRRGTLSFNSGLRLTDFSDNLLVNRDLKSYEFGGRYNYSLSRTSGLHLGYTYRNGVYQTERKTVEHGIDVGMDYDRPLSHTRRTTVSFSFGSAIVDGPVGDRIATPSGESPILRESARQFRVVGNASLKHSMGRTWYAVGTYERGLAFIEELAQPVFTNAVTVSVGGYTSRRTDLAMSAAYTDGEAAFFATQSGLKTYTGNVRYRYAASRAWSAYAEYLYYFYDFSRNLTRAPFITPGFQRNGVRVGMTLWVPERRR